MKKTNNVVKKVAAITGAVAIVAGTILGAVAFPIQNEIIVTEYKTITKEVPVIQTVVQEKEVIVEVEKEVIVKVDNENLDFVLEQLYDNNGNLELVTEDLFEDELDQIVERLFMLEEVKTLAIADVKANLAKELDYQLGYDKRDVSRIDIDSSDVEVLNIDFSREDATILVPVEFRYDGVIETVTVEVAIRNGVVRSFDFV